MAQNKIFLKSIQTSDIYDTYNAQSIIKVEIKVSANFISKQYGCSKQNKQPRDGLIIFELSINKLINQQVLQINQKCSIQGNTSKFVLQSAQKPIKIYEDFENRGKHECLKFFFSKQKQRITLLISQNYFLNDLKCRQVDLLQVYKSFTKTWQEQYIQMMQAFIKYAKQFRANNIVKFQFVAIDVIGITFDVSYHNKVGEKLSQLKRFRFRYSIFQFRQNPFFEQKNTEQTMTFVEVNNSNTNSISQQDFYNSMRLSFIDDINNNSNQLWKRVIVRFWVFYQIHCLNRGVTEFEEFNKKALGRVHFHPTRMKKFQLIFPFPLLHKSVIDQKKEGVLYFTFYIDDKDISMNQKGLEFKMIGNMVEHHGILTYQQKQELFYRLKKQREEIYALMERQQIPKSNELFQFSMVLKFDDRISRAFAKFQTTVSFFLDKLAFNQIRTSTSNHRQISQEDIQWQRIIQLYSKPVIYKQNQYSHTHQLILQLKHKYSPLVGYQNQNPVQGQRFTDEIQFFKLQKKRIKRNVKQQKDQSVQKVELIINDELKRFISHILKNNPLRQSNNQIMKYIQNVIKVIYSPFKENNSLIKYENKEIVLSLIISNIIKFLDLGPHHSRKTQINIITEDNPLFVRQQNEQDLIAEITFSLKELKVYWIKRLPLGYIIIRMFEDKIEIIKDLNGKIVIKINYQNIEKTTSSELNQELRNILMKQFATLQNMMV